MWQRSSLVRVVDESARAQRREHGRAEFERLVVGVLWAVWSIRVELSLVLLLVAVQRATAGVGGDVVGFVVVGSMLAGALVARPVRQALFRLLHAMSVRRAWAWATID